MGTARQHLNSVYATSLRASRLKPAYPRPRDATNRLNSRFVAGEAVEKAPHDQMRIGRGRATGFLRPFEGDLAKRVIIFSRFCALYCNFDGLICHFKNRFPGLLQPKAEAMTLRYSPNPRKSTQNLKKV